MGLNSLPLFTALAEKMRWHQSRQGLLAENVANAETPGFRGRDLQAFTFKDHLPGAEGMRVATVATAREHIVALGPDDGAFRTRTVDGFEITPNGNSVTLEDEMMKVAQNQMDYQTVTTLYTRSMRLLRTALGRQG